jgi:S-DNA-T family DNA segregation ATPase FtsK/SpoIIIE
MRNADMVGTQLRAIHFGKWHVALDVCAAHKLGTDEIRKRLGTVERCFDGMRNGARVEPLGERARMARIRLMTGDPHAVPLAPPELGTVPIVPAGTCHFVPVGTFETGTPVLVDVRQHILVAGRTNSGKSTLIQVIMRAATTMPWMAVVAVDMKPGAPELGRWNDKVAFLGRNAEDAAVMLTKLKDGLQARGEIMAARGWQTWHPTPAEPHIMVIVDEAQGITQAELGGELSEVAALLRAYGGSLLLATQYPIVDNLPSTVTQQMSTTIGLRTKNATADRVIFGQDATREGWTPSKLPMNKFLILSDLYDTPLPAKGFYLNSPALAEAVDLAPEPIPVDGATWPGLAAPERLHAVSLHKPGQLHAATPAEHSQVTRSKANRVKVLKALVALGPEAHRSAIEDATGLDQKTVDTHLKALAEEGTATKVRRGVWRSAA